MGHEKRHSRIFADSVATVAVTVAMGVSAILPIQLKNRAGDLERLLRVVGAVRWWHLVRTAAPGRLPRSRSRSRGPAVPGVPGRHQRSALVSGTPSDAHTWNLVYLQLFLEEQGYAVTNLGACTPAELLISEGIARGPDVIVLSSINGHGHRDGLDIVRALRAVPELAGTRVVIGGKLGIGGPEPSRAAELLAAGFDAVFEDGAGGDLMPSFIEALTAEDPA